MELPRRSSKAWKLFKYLVSQKGNRVQQADLIEVLWPEEDCSDPQHALRTMVYRLRSSLNGRFTLGEKELISTSQGSYMLDPTACWVDVEEFETLCTYAQSYKEGKPGRAIQLYQQALSLYQGEYLPECQEEWVIPLRAYYRNLYVKSVLSLSELLQQNQNHQEIINICQKAVIMAPFEENLHYVYMDALIQEGKLDEAREHYQFVEVHFQQKLGDKPSSELQRLYQQTQLQETEPQKELQLIRQYLSEDKDNNKEGAFFCNPENFRLFYQLEVRRQERNQLPGVLCLVYLKKSAVLEKECLASETVKTLKDVLLQNLRKGDVVCRWNEFQFMVLLHGCDVEGARTVIRRIKQCYRQACETGNIPVFFRVLYLKSEYGLRGLSRK